MSSPPSTSATEIAALDTKARMLDVAERLFAERGLDSTSIRDITNEAQVNLGAVNYHFGTKDGLIKAVFERRIIPLNEERIRALDALEQRSKDGAPVPVEAILDALLRPTLHMKLDPARGGINFTTLLGRSLSEPKPCVEELLKKHFEPVIERFYSALLKALPHVHRGELFWRLSFTFGALHRWLLQSTAWIPTWAAEPDTEQQFKSLIAFAAAGMQTTPALKTPNAPSSSSRRKSYVP